MIDLSTLPNSPPAATANNEVPEDFVQESGVPESVVPESVVPEGVVPVAIVPVEGVLEIAQVEEVPETVLPENESDMPVESAVVPPIPPQDVVPVAQPSTSTLPVVSPLPEDEVPEDEVPEDNAEIPAVATTSQDDPSSTMLPPSQIPQVNLLPPTPNASQDGANSGPTTLLKVPEPPPHMEDAPSSPVPEVSQPRRSPRLTSPAPGSKRPPSGPLEEPPSKKPREQ